MVRIELTLKQAEALLRRPQDGTPDRNLRDAQTEIRSVIQRYRSRRPRTTPDALTTTELEKLWEAVPDSRGRAVLAVECLGLKPMEVHLLDLDDVDFEEKRLHVRRGLGGRPRTVEIDHVTLERLAQWRRDRPDVPDPAFFISAEKQRLASRTIRTDHKKWATLADVDRKKVHPHSLRHTWSLLKLLQGMPEAEQRAKLGLLSGSSAVEALAVLATKERSRNGISP